MSRFSPIHHTFGPHVDNAYLRRTLALSYKPWGYREGPDREKLKTALQKHYNRDATLFASGREALLALLQSLGLPAGSDVIVQGFTCVVVPNAIHAAGMKTIYADIDPETLNMTTETVLEVATIKTKAVICQHTFGIPSPTKELRDLCSMKGWILIEDCAHILPDSSGPSALLVHSDYAICSFGRDKAISGIGGGAVLSRIIGTTQKLRELERKANEVSFFGVLRLLEYPPRMAHLVRPFIGLGLAGLLVAIQHLLGLFVPVLTKEEKEGKMPATLRRLPNACASLALRELKNLKQINEHRRTLVKFFKEAAVKNGWKALEGIHDNFPLQKFPLWVSDAASIRKKLRAENIHLDDGWTGCVVCPGSCDTGAAGYTEGMDPKAEEAALSILSLPTHPTMTLKQAEKLVSILDPLLHP